MINIGDISKPGVDKHLVKSRKKANASNPLEPAAPVKRMNKTGADKQQQQKNPEEDKKLRGATKDSANQQENLTYDKDGQHTPGKKLDYKI